MAERLAQLHGTEKDKVNCPFYHKIGACRHGDRCSRLHNKPEVSRTLLLPHLFQAALTNTAVPATQGAQESFERREEQEFFEDFYEDVFMELAAHGTLEALNVCDNSADHLVGNVYAKFRDEESATAAKKALEGRFYAGRPIHSEYSPVTDFREATCRQYDEHTCTRGGYCNFLHLKPITRTLRHELYCGQCSSQGERQREEGRGYGRRGYDRRDDYYRDRDRDYRRRERSPPRAAPQEQPREERESTPERRARIQAWNEARRRENAAK